MIVTCLSVCEPYASLIRSGKKPIETRVWNTKYRGKLLICATKKPESEFSGKAVAIVDLVDCREMVKEDEAAACCEIYPNAQSWILEGVKPIEPFPVTGMQRLFKINIPDEMWERMIKEAKR